MEKWDAYDSRLNKIEDLTLIRGEKIPEGVFHLVSDIVVQHTDGSFLIMQRDPRKHLGGMWELTAGGSALQGEDPLSCAVRELQEETGIAAEKPVEIGRVLHHGHQTWYVEYLCTTDTDKDAITLQEGETSGYKWVTGGELRNMTRDEIASQRILNFIKELR